MHEVLRGQGTHAVPSQSEWPRGVATALHQLHEGVLTSFVPTVAKWMPKQGDS